LSASDSFVTQTLANGKRMRVESEASKLVRVPAFRGVMAYWGLATLGSDWDTKRWLTTVARLAGNYGSAEEYALGLANLLNKGLARRSLVAKSGLGIHFTAYEPIDGYRIPELSVITNWRDASYSKIEPTGFYVTRETYRTLLQLNIEHRLTSEHRSEANRRQVHEALHEKAVMFRFNNGDPAIFNPIGNAAFETFATLYQRGDLRHAQSADTHLSLVRRPIELVSKLLIDLAVTKSRVIGGRPHAIAVNPHGQYFSNTGD
jgi:hypothetical protein